MDSNRTIEEQQLTINDEVDHHIFFNLIQRVGSMGKYQVSMCVVLSMVSMVSGGLVLMTPFIFYQDPYLCPELPTPKSCLDFVCSLQPSDRSSYIPDPLIHSLANRFGDYHCPSEMAYLNIFKSLLYFGTVVGMMFVSVAGDLFGRRTLIITFLSMTLIGVLLAIFGTELWIGGTGIFLSTLGMKINFTVINFYLAEIFDEKYRSKFLYFIISLSSVGGLANVLYYFALRDYQLILSIFFAFPTLIALLSFIFIFKETPFCLITKTSPQKVCKDLKAIAKMNKVTSFNISPSQIQAIQAKYSRQFTTNNKMQTFTIIDLFRYKSLRIITIQLIFLDCVLALQFYTPTLILGQFDFNIFINGTVVQSSIILVVIFGYIAISKFRRRIMAISSFAVIVVCSTVLVFIWDQQKQNTPELSNNIIVLMFVFVIQFTIANEFNFYVIYLTQLYPTQVRANAIGFIKTFGAIIAVLASQIISACFNSGFKIMLLFAILAVLSIISSYMLPETFGVKPPQIIKELQEKRQNENKSSLFTDKTDYD